MHLGLIIPLALTAAAFSTEPIKQPREMEPVKIEHLLSPGVQAWRGFAPAYRDGLMGEVAKRRGMKVSGCLIATPFGEIGDKFYLYGVNTGFLELCTKVDTSHPKHLAGHLERRIYAEIPGELQKAICGHRNEPSRRCPITLIRWAEVE